MPDVAIDLTRFTPTERRIVSLLSDGYAHTAKELFGLLDDELAGRTAVAVHVCNIRSKLPPHLSVLSHGSNGSVKYAMIRYVGTCDS